VGPMRMLPLAAVVAAAVAAGLALFAAAVGYHPLVLIPVAALAVGGGWWVTHLGRKVRESERERFFGGVCLQCGYDMRSNRDRCSECGAMVWTPDKPLALPHTLWPEAPQRFTAFIDPSEVIHWMLERRRPTPWEAWGEDPNFRRVATTLIQGCRPCDEGPFGRYLPCDPFHVLPVGATAGSFTRMISETLNVDLSTEDLYAIEKMTIGEVTEMIARRVPARRFYARLSSESDRAA
jgi:hypothetical protein